jgi:patatin-related protein
LTDGGDQSELRLALVCYGGASLAIYMHGLTKEVNRLAVGSAIRAAGGASPQGTETVYGELLAERAKLNEGVETRVVVDIIAGTSAGGINGIYLAKAIAHNLSQDGLRDLWFRRGDMKQLLRGPTFLPWWSRLPVLVPLFPFQSPVRGDAMANWLFSALEAMDDSASQPPDITSLIEPPQKLELYVTITDFYGYDRQLQLADPTTIHEGRHRHALAFTYESGGSDDFTRDGNAGLAFAARTTSSFPGVFPPVSFEEFHKWVPAANLAPFAERCFRIYALAGADPHSTQFVDGGVLDNKPFAWAIDAIARRRADFEVDRRLLYLEPDPGEERLPAEGEPARHYEPPTPLKSIAGALAGLPREEPILDDILAVNAHNERVRRLQDVIVTSWEPVAQVVQDALGPVDDLPSDPKVEELTEWSRTMHERTIKESGVAYATYVRLKISGTVDAYADSVCRVCEFPDDSNHAALVRLTTRSLARNLGLFEPAVTPTDAQLGFLRNFDLGFGERRLLFVIAAVRWWYRDLRQRKPDIPPRDQLDRAKRVLYDAVELLHNTMGGAAYPEELAAAVRSAFPVEPAREFLETNGLDGIAYAKEHGDQLTAVSRQLATFNEQQLEGFSANLFVELNEIARGWPAARRRDLMVRYLGFPLWDVLLYPIQHGANVGEKDHVDVVRLSPVEASILKTPGREKVKGRKWGHFWAFFDRSARENDYLWGRLDGAAEMVGLVIGKGHPEYRSWCLRAFQTILEEEAGALKSIKKTVEELKKEVADARGRS